MDIDKYNLPKEPSERDKPTDADEYSWQEFETLAFEEDIGNYTEDWIIFWKFWKKSYKTALSVFGLKHHF